MEDKALYKAVLAGGLLFVLGQYVASQPLRVSEEIEANRQITVSGTAEIATRPDIASLSLTVNTEPQKTAEAALALLASRFNAVVDAVKDQGVDEDDITTSNLSINPRYNFREGKQELIGFEASESIRVKIRDLDKVGAVLGVATVEGVNQAGGISFEIDDPEALELEAQEEAIEKAKDNAKQLAKALGAKLGKVKSFDSFSGGQPPIPIFARAETLSLDAVGGSAPEPEVNPGTQDVTSTVTITYELK